MEYSLDAQQFCHGIGDVLVLESSPRAGGKIRTELDAGHTVEWGPQGFLDNAPDTLELASSWADRYLDPSLAMFGDHLAVRYPRLFRLARGLFGHRIAGHLANGRAEAHDEIRRVRPHGLRAAGTDRGVGREEESGDEDARVCKDIPDSACNDQPRNFFAYLVANLLNKVADEIASAKLYASEMLARVTDEAIQIFGDMGLMDELPLERFWRDARVERIYAGTNEIMKVLIARTL